MDGKLAYRNNVAPIHQTWDDDINTVVWETLDSAALRHMFYENNI